MGIGGDRVGIGDDPMVVAQTVGGHELARVGIDVVRVRIRIRIADCHQPNSTRRQWLLRWQTKTIVLVARYVTSECLLL